MKKFLECVAHEKDDIYKAYWNFCKTGVMTLVLDEEDKFVGAVGVKEYEKAMVYGGVECVSEITNYNCTVIGGDHLYEQARNIYYEKNIEWLPVLDAERNLVDVFSRRRAFYKKYFEEGKLPYLHYARIVWAAANEAKKLGLMAISVIEFGVAGGNGLLALEFHAREIGRLFDIEIQVYGFDTGEGLPEYETDYKDQLFRFKMGAYKMNFSQLAEKLTSAKLVLGDIHATSLQFWEMCPAPIGAMMVDVDIYTSTIPVLQMLETDCKNVLPRIFMYFDDIFKGYENIGENLAIKEFNERNQGSISISPEGTGRDYDAFSLGCTAQSAKGETIEMKVCHYFRHPMYNVYIAPREWGEAPLKQYIL
ncbi:MAG: CBS domain-containing protein [Lachnospiraceae bacterium]|jgi:hypothetical protein|nr:CBS domain-containing protein [Lachnospiraceae bacterium]